MTLTASLLRACGLQSLQPGQAEADAWVTAGTSAPHPLLNYSAVNRVRLPAVKSIVRPEVRPGPQARSVRPCEREIAQGSMLFTAGVLLGNHPANTRVNVLMWTPCCLNE